MTKIKILLVFFICKSFYAWNGWMLKKILSGTFFTGCFGWN